MFGVVFIVICWNKYKFLYTLNPATFIFESAQRCYLQVMYCFSRCSVIIFIHLLSVLMQAVMPAVSYIDSGFVCVILCGIEQKIVEIPTYETSIMMHFQVEGDITGW